MVNNQQKKCILHSCNGTVIKGEYCSNCYTITNINSRLYKLLEFYRNYVNTLVSEGYVINKKSDNVSQLNKYKKGKCRVPFCNNVLYKEGINMCHYCYYHIYKDIVKVVQ